MEIAPATRIGPVELTVSDLERSPEYWQRDIGLQLLAREDGTAALGGAEPLVRDRADCVAGAERGGG